jgi:phosphopantetheinyl transferase (holo-ACP synthase)
VETVDRFQSVAENDDRFMPLVFTQKEVEHARRQISPGRTLCVAFSCKEALLKALRHPYNFTQCETFPVLNGRQSAYEGSLRLSPDPNGPFVTLAATMRTFSNPNTNTEIITIVYLFGEERP